MWLAATDDTNFEPDVLQAAVVVSYLAGLTGMVAVGGWLSLPAFALLFLGAQLIFPGAYGAIGSFVIEAPIILLGMAAAAAVPSLRRFFAQPRPPLWSGGGRD